MKQVLATVVSTKEVMPGVFLTWFEAPEVARSARPGQFVMVRCGEEALLRRPLSIHQRDGGRIALLFAVVGKGTGWLAQGQPGDSVDLLGPLGNGFSVDPGAHNLLLVAGGIGIAPLPFLAKTVLDRGRSVILLQGASSAVQLCPVHLLPAGTRCMTSTEDGTTGKRGMITSLLPDYIGWADQIFACGPNSMYQTIAEQNRKMLKPKPVQVSLEVSMGCGLGVCYGCTVKTRQGLKQVCQDGPVFELKDILQDVYPFI